MSKSLLQLIDVKKKYGTFEALKGIALEILPGEIVSLLGVNGAGKTTLSSIIATLHPPTSGDLLFHGQPVFENLPHYRQHIGYCQQKPNLNPLLSLKDNLYFAGKFYGLQNHEIEERIEELNQQLGINDFLTHYPTQLSGGWKQRFMIARSLIHNPQLVIFDEPTVALDPDIRYQLWNYIRHLKGKGISVLLTTHYLDEAEALSDRVCLLHNGLVKLIDTPQNLIKTFEKGRLEEVFLQLTQEQKD